MVAIASIATAALWGAPAQALTSDQAWQQFLADQTRHLPASGYPYQHCFAESAQRYELPEALLLAVGRGESDLDPLARSHANAYGLMQIQWPGTAKHLGIHNLRTLLNPCRNVDAGARYLKELLARYGNLERALAAYNVGPGRVARQADVPLPGAGHRYSRYIYRQLAKGGDRGATPSARPAKGPSGASAAPVVSTVSAAYPQSHHLVVFDSPVRAHSLAHALSRRYPQLEVTAQRLDARNFAVTVVLDSEANANASREALRRAGFALP